MKVRNRDTELPVNMIYPHPNNPRRDVGDVMELAESIKINGIFQNLTVIEGGKGAGDDADGYTVIIGHRRLAAAKLAGLEYVPCMVVEMDEREQAATMLLENMQRADLTVYEQAQGFQMMLDLGETQDGIAEKTGFSKSTIRHRLKLLELDEKEFAKAQERQATFADYIELEKLKDPKNKTEALKTIGTANFKYTVDRLVNKEKLSVNLEKLRKALKNSGLTKLDAKERYEYKQLGCVSALGGTSVEQKEAEINALIKKGVKYYYLEQSTTYGWFYFYADKPQETEEEKAARREREDSENKRRIAVKTIESEEERAQGLRKNYVKAFSNRDHILHLTECLLTNYSLDGVDFKEVAKLNGITLSEDELYSDVVTNTEYKRLVKKHPESVILAMLYTIYECYRRNILHDYTGKFKRSETLEEWYEILESVGYTISDDERKLLSGEHECFARE